MAKDLESLETLLSLRTILNSMLEELAITVEKLNRIERGSPPPKRGDSYKRRIGSLVEECLLSIAVAQEKIQEAQAHLEELSGKPLKEVSDCAKKNT